MSRSNDKVVGNRNFLNEAKYRLDSAESKTQSGPTLVNISKEAVTSESVV